MVGHRGRSPWLSGRTLEAATGFFVAAIVFLRPYKRAAKARRASEAGP